METALAISTPKRMRAPDKKDRVRWYLTRRGYSPDTIALEQGCKVQEVHASVQRVIAYQAEVSNEAVDMKVNEVVLRSLDRAGRVLESAMDAKNVKRVVVGNKVKKYAEPDHATRLKAVETMKNLMESSRPKTPLISNTNNTQINNTRPTDSDGRPLSFEERIRRLREKNGEPETIEAEVVEPGTVQDELNEIGIDVEADDGDSEEE